LVEDFFGEGADHGLPAQGAVEVLFGALEDVVDVQGAFGSYESRT
jgi:hypothetical protein